MKSFELLRAAATLILEGGWANGAGDAADAEGNPIDLWVTGSTETGRAAPNPAAVKFSIYGAIVSALHRNGGRLEDPAAMWVLLSKRAAEINNVPHGGDNFVHPLRQFNATQVDPIKVLAFLGRCADELEGVAQAVAMLKSEPFEVRAIPRLAEPKPYPGVALGPHPSEPMQIARALKAAVDAPQAPLEPIKLTPEDVQDLHSTLAVPLSDASIAALTDVLPAKPYKPMLTPRLVLREEHPPALYSGPELNMKGMPNPFGGDDEQS